METMRQRRPGVNLINFYKCNLQISAIVSEVEDNRYTCKLHYLVKVLLN